MDVLRATLLHREAQARRRVIEAYWVGLGEFHPLSLHSIATNHGTEASPWLVYRGAVVDCTQWQHFHPGGKLSITSLAGCDCTLDFDRIHSKNAVNRVNEYTIGKVYVHPSAVPATFNSAAESMMQINQQLTHHAATVARSEASPAAAAAAPQSESAAIEDATTRLSKLTALAATLSRPPVDEAFMGTPISRTESGDAAVASTAPSRVIDARSTIPTIIGKVVSVDDLGSRIKAVTIETPRSLEVYPGGHISVLIGPLGEASRPYSPVHFDGARFTIIVKLYPGPSLGGTYLHALRPGDAVTLRGPHMPAFVLRNHVENTTRPVHLVLIAGGTGVAPILNIARAALRRAPEIVEHVSVLVSFRNRDDAMLVKEVELLHDGKRCRVTLCYTRDPDAVRVPRPPNMPQLRGQRVNTALIQSVMAGFARGGERRVAVVCGPPDMNVALPPALVTELGLDKADVHCLG
jgi:NAD(P)H-flavin reductase